MNSSLTTTDPGDYRTSTNDDYVSTNLSNHGASNVSLWQFGYYSDPGGAIALQIILRGVVMPIIAAFGLAANALNAALLIRLTRRKSSPTYCILLSMTVADFVIAAWSLLGSALQYMRNDPILSVVDLDRLSSSGRAIYDTLDPTANLFAFISNWCTTAVAAVRFMAVYYPLKSQHWCTQRRTVIALAGTATSAMLFTVLPHILIISESVSRHPRAYYVVYAIVADVLPWTLCVIFVSLLLVSLRRRSSRSTAVSKRGDHKFDKRQMLTATLIGTVAWFIVTTAPSTVSVVISFWNEDAVHSSVSLSILFDIGQLLALINFAGNVFFYSLINSSHRRQLIELLWEITNRCSRSTILARMPSKQSRFTRVAVLNGTLV